MAAILHNRAWAALLLAGLILPVVVLGGAFARNSSFGILFNSSGIFCSLCRFWVVQDGARYVTYVAIRTLFRDILKMAKMCK